MTITNVILLFFRLKNSREGAIFTFDGKGIFFFTGGACDPKLSFFVINKFSQCQKTSDLPPFFTALIRGARGKHPNLKLKQK
jgi:hypothetical protein